MNMLSRCLCQVGSSLAIMLLLTVGLFAEGEVTYPIVWDPVESAGGYIVEVTNDHQAPVENQIVKTPKIVLKLYPGVYAVRLTTLNRFMRNEAVTEWMQFHVLAPSPPDFLGIEPKTVRTGKTQTMVLTVANFSREGTLTVQAPSGADLPAKVSQNSPTTMTIELPALDETGAYAVTLLNPPNRMRREMAAFTAQYPAPVVKAIEPDGFSADQSPETITVKGTDFLSMMTVSLEIDGNPQDLEVISRADDGVVVALPKTLKPGAYTLTLGNGAEAASMVTAELHIGPIPPAVATKDRDMLYTLGWNYTNLINRWNRWYGSSAKALGLGFETYFTPNRLPVTGAAINVGARLAAMYTFYSSKPEILQTYTYSEMSILSLYLAPSVELAFPFMMIRFYLGGGLAYSVVNGSDASGNGLKQGSWDWLAIGRLAVDVPIAEFLRLEVAAETRVYFMTETMASLTIDAGVVFSLPY